MVVGKFAQNTVDSEKDEWNCNQSYYARAISGILGAISKMNCSEVKCAGQIQWKRPDVWTERGQQKKEKEKGKKNEEEKKEEDNEQKEEEKTGEKKKEDEEKKKEEEKDEKEKEEEAEKKKKRRKKKTVHKTIRRNARNTEN